MIKKCYDQALMRCKVEEIFKQHGVNISHDHRVPKIDPPEAVVKETRDVKPKFSPFILKNYFVCGKRIKNY